MQYSEEWKTLFPISWVHAPPLLSQDSSLGPLFFNPVPQSLSLLFSSSDLSPPVLPSPSVVPSNSNIFHRNRLEPLYCTNNQVIIFFPTGSNFDCVGFLVLSGRERDSKLVVDSSTDANVFTSQITFAHQIILLTACPISDSSFPGEGTSAFVGFLLACNSYAANWFSVHISASSSDSNKPSLVFMGSKKFSSSAVASACWNPHLPGECVVLLESGTLFLFDMDSSLDTRFRGKRIRVTWDELGGSAGWFSCEFSWHPRILVVANAKAIYMVDLRSGKCQYTCLLRIDLPGMTDLFAKDKFVLFSRAESEGFLYTVATEQWLLLCDVRKPLMPVLSWAHHLHQPHYMNVLPLSDLRSVPHDKRVGACAVILGSFWNKEFSFFFYGRPHPATTSSSLSDLSDFSNSFYAWELPSKFLLSGQNCLCANCLLKEEFAKDDIPEWIEWQQKQALVLGFCILTNNISSLLPNPGEHGGFTLVRLMSTGKLESQQYCASWEMARITAAAHKETISLKDSLLCSMGEEKYKFPRRFRYIKLESLYDYFGDNFAESMSTRFKNSGATAGLKKYFNGHSKKFTSDNLNPLGCGPSMSDLSVAVVFRDVNMPTSVYEVNNRMMWAKSPLNLLEVAFPAIPLGNQAPPFFLRNPSHCRSTKVRQGADFLGPVIPLPVLTVMKEVSRHGNFSVDEVNSISSEDIVTPQCEYVMRLTKEIRSLNAGYKRGKAHVVSLKQDWDEPWVNSSGSRPFFSYKPSAFLDETEDDNTSVLGERYSTIIAKVAKDGGGFFDDLCPMDLKFDPCSNIQESSVEELSAYKLLKKQFSQWQMDFMPYQNLHKQIREQMLLSRP